MSSVDSKAVRSGQRWTTEKIMTSGPASEPLRPNRFPDLPAWLISTAVHLMALIFVTAISIVIPHGTNSEVGDLVSITGDFSDPGDSTFFSTEPQASGLQFSTSSATSLAAAVATSSGNSNGGPPVKSVELLASVTGAGAMPGGASGIGSVAGAIGLPGGGARGGGSGAGPGKSTTNVFGLEGKGSSFVYLFDRSESMDGFGGRPMAAAKRQLIESLKQLDDNAQFQIIFYNESPRRYSGIDGTQNMVFATEKNREHAINYVRNSIRADGKTDHLPALKQAINLGPSVIFFLTDADDPISQRNMDDLVSRCGSTTTIHSIEFGDRPKQSGRSWIETLANRTGGQYRYVDVTSLE